MKNKNKLVEWFCEGKSFYILILLLAFIGVLGKINLGFQTVDNIRYYGLFLQLIGAIIIVYSLKMKLILFKGHGLIKFYLDYFKRFPLIRKPNSYRLEAGPAHFKISVGDARLYVKPKEDIKDIIRYIEEELKYIHEKINSTKRELKDEIQNLTNTVKNLDQKYNTEIFETKELIATSAVSNIWSESFGVCCVFIGLILVTIPEIVDRII